MEFRRLKLPKVNEKGQSLIQVLVAVAITGVITLAIANLISQQNRALMIISDKVARLDLEKLLISTLANGSICTAELASSSFNEAAPFSVDPNAPSETVINLSSIHSSSAPGAPPLVSIGEYVSAISNTLKIGAIRYNNFTSTGTSNEYFANLEVSFQQNSMAQALKSIKIRTKISTDAANRITSCWDAGLPAGSGSGSGAGAEAEAETEAEVETGTGTAWNGYAGLEGRTLDTGVLPHTGGALPGYVRGMAMVDNNGVPHTRLIYVSNVTNYDSGWEPGESKSDGAGAATTLSLSPAGMTFESRYVTNTGFAYHRRAIKW